MTIRDRILTRLLGRGAVVVHPHPTRFNRRKFTAHGEHVYYGPNDCVVVVCNYVTGRAELVLDSVSNIVPSAIPDTLDALHDAAAWVTEFQEFQEEKSQRFTAEQAAQAAALDRQNDHYRRYPR